MEESVRNCHFCGTQTVTPYRCPKCGYLFCRQHRLPEQHGCVAGKKPSRKETRHRRGGLVRLVARVAVVIVVLGVSLYTLDLFGMVDLQGLVGQLQGFVAELT